MVKSGEKWGDIRMKIESESERIWEQKLSWKMVEYKNENWVKKWWNIRTKSVAKIGEI